MSGIDYDAILKTIVGANSKSDGSNAKNILKTDIINNTITGRLVPNLKDVAHSIYRYFHHGWKSKLDGFGIFSLCPNTHNEKCPICQRSIQMWKSGDPAKIESSKGIRRRENYMVNFYVISDVKHPENNNTLKILRYGKQIADKIKLATEGDDKEIYGPKIWRLDEQGCNFRIKCEQNSTSKEAWPTYTNSSFLPPSKIEGMTDIKIQEILGSVFDLTKQYTPKTFDELLKEMDKHYFINEINDVQTTLAQNTTVDQIHKAINEQRTQSVAQPAAPVPSTQSTVPVAPVDNKPAPASTGDVNEDQLDKMLEELQG